MIPYTARRVFQSALFVEIDQIWDYINQPASNPLLHYQDGPYIYDIPAFNEETTREGILNAICHRSLQIQSEVVVKQYPDGITITNAGGFPSGVDQDNILTVNSIPRCKLLSDVLEKTNLVERSGQGVDKMFYNCLMEGKPLPTYDGTDSYQVQLNLNAVIAEQELLKFFRREQQRRPEDNKLNVFDLLTLYKVHKHDVGDMNEESVRRLQKENLLDVSDGRYKILGSYVDEYADVAEALDFSVLKTIHGLFKQNTRISRALMNEALTGVLTDRQVRVLITKMESLGLIQREGEKRGVRYLQTERFARMF